MPESENQVQIPKRKRGPGNKYGSKKNAALALALDPNLTITQIAKDLGIPESTVGTWVRLERKRQESEEGGGGSSSHSPMKL
jgi:transposase-like protein